MSSQSVKPQTVEHLNHVVLLGEVSNQPTSKPLPSGDVLLSFDLRVPGDSGPRQSVPVTWIGAPGKEPTLEDGRDTLVVGQVHRRFYRGGGQLSSRVDVRASTVVTATPGRVRRALAPVLESLER